MILLKKVAPTATFKNRLHSQKYLNPRRLSSPIFKYFSQSQKIPRRPANRIKITGQVDLRKVV